MHPMLYALHLSITLTQNLILYAFLVRLGHHGRWMLWPCCGITGREPCSCSKARKMGFIDDVSIIVAYVMIQQHQILE